MEKMTDKNDYNFAFLDEGSKREIRRCLLYTSTLDCFVETNGLAKQQKEKRSMKNSKIE